MTASEILAEVGERRSSLPLERKRMPVLVFRTLRQGLIWEVEGRDLELTEVRDMMTHSRKQKDGWEIPEAKYTRSLQDRPKDLLRQLKVPESQLGRVAKSAIQVALSELMRDARIGPELYDLEGDELGTRFVVRCTQSFHLCSFPKSYLMFCPAFALWPRCLGGA